MVIKESGIGEMANQSFQWVMTAVENNGIVLLGDYKVRV